MTTETQNKGLRVEEGKTKLITSHNNTDLTFIHPAYGPDIYANVGAEIEQAGLSKPIMAETASLVHAAINSKDQYSQKIMDLMRKRWLWAFTGSLYVPRGAYIQDNPEIRDNMPFMEESDLVRKLEASDSSVRFVPFGFKIGEMTPSELAENAYVRALAGAEGAEKLAEVAGKYKHNPYLFSFDSVDRPLTRVSALVSSWGFDVRLYVDGNYYGCGDGYALGVQKTGEASRAEN